MALSSQALAPITTIVKTWLIVLRQAGSGSVSDTAIQVATTKSSTRRRLRAGPKLR